MKRIGIIVLIFIVLISNGFAYGNEDTIRIEIKDEYNEVEKIIGKDVNLDRIYIPIEIEKGQMAKFKINFNKSIDPQNLYFNKEDMVDNPNFYVHIRPDEGMVIIEAYEVEKDYDLVIEYEEYFKNKLGKEPLDDKGHILELIKYYEEKNFKDFTKKLKDLQLDSKDEEDLKLKYIVEYYTGRFFYEMKDYERAIENFKTGYIIENRNIYYNIMANKELGNMDKVLEDFKKSLRGDKKSGLYIWAKKEIKNLPQIYEEKLIVKEIDKKPMEKKKFSYRSFILMNSGIFILFLVIYHNIKKS
ncbi:MAG: hypothetical protein N4A57_14695 [Anaeromicrobium sp.]|jgi:tetratricopeptide (TPR) repeat protein|uniref:hypothetical protein n=1 Tax=Anaeromicrobium sp. TaxID=1929132 RepID=UPI0025D3D2FF|nr:hypothetical protein [Anaeromicrobium sp.]MCT4595494.1 hypothetical protein [Anaeromicrobium sp.]